MRPKSARALAVVVLLPYLAAAALAGSGLWQWKKLTAPGRNTKTATAAAAKADLAKTQADQVAAQADAVKAAVAQAGTAHQAEVATHRAIENNAAVFVEASTQVLKSDPSPSTETIIAIDLNDAAAAALGVHLSPEQLRIVSTLIKKNREASEEIAKLKGEAIATRARLDAVTAQATTADALAKDLIAKLDTSTHELTATATKAATLAESNKRWADDALSLWDRIKALGWLAVFLALFAFGTVWKLFGFRTALHDSVALGEFLKDHAFAAGHDAVNLEQKIHAWWEGDANQVRIAKIKSNILRK